MPSAGLFVPGSSPGSRPHMRVDISLDINLASLRFELQRFLPGVTTAQVRDIAVDNDGDLGLIFAWATRDASATCGRNTALVTVGSFVAVTEQGQGSGSAADAAPREWRGHVVKLDQGGETVVVANDTNHKEYINIKAATQVRPILLRSVRGFVVSPTRLATAYSAERKPSKALANAAGEGKLDVPFWNRVWAHVWQDTLDSTNFATLAKWDAKSRSGNAPKLRAHDALALKEVFRVYFLEQQPAQIVSHADPNAKPAAVPRGLGGDARPLQKRFSKWNAREHRAFLRAYASGLSLQEAVRLVPTRSKDQIRHHTWLFEQKNGGPAGAFRKAVAKRKPSRSVSKSDQPRKQPRWQSNEEDNGADSAIDIASLQVIQCPFCQFNGNTAMNERCSECNGPTPRWLVPATVSI